MQKNHAPVFDRIAAAISKDPSKAIARFEAVSHQTTGLQSEVEVRDFLLTVDESEMLGGNNAGPNPVELILAAIATCQEITCRLYADRLGIHLESVSVSVSGDIDIRGMFALDPSARPGLKGLDVTVELDSTAPQAELERLKQTVDAHCPVLDIIRHATPISARTSRHEDSEISHASALFAGLAG